MCALKIDSEALTADNTLGASPAPVPRDVVKLIAVDIGKEVAAYIERMYPKAVAATSSTFMLSLRNCIYNEIMAALVETDPDKIEMRLADRKIARRKLRALSKAARITTPDTPKEQVDLMLMGALSGPDIGEERDV